MWRRALTIMIPLVLWLGCSGDQGPTADAMTQVIVSRAAHVRQSRLYAHVEALSSIHSRWMHYDPGTTATLDWLGETLADQGTPAVADSFVIHRIRDIPTANLVVTLPGQTRPNEYVLVGAHWDCQSYPESWTDSTARAAGAIDNATGVAALVELARVLADAPLARTVQIIFWAGEEIGMFGSRRVATAWRHPSAGDSLVCVVNVDMIGWDGDLRRDASLVCDTLSAPLAGAALPYAQLAASPLLVDSLNRGTGSWGVSSDHLQFWYYALPAIWLHEGIADAYPFANHAADSLPDLQPDYLADATRALVGTVMALAEPITP